MKFNIHSRLWDVAALVIGVALAYILVSCELSDTSVGLPAGKPLVDTDDCLAIVWPC